jgi:tetratricopeptide (TPR) repeat protein
MDYKEKPTAWLRAGEEAALSHDSLLETGDDLKSRPQSLGDTEEAADSDDADDAERKVEGRKRTQGEAKGGQRRKGQGEAQGENKDEFPEDEEDDEDDQPDLHNHREYFRAQAQKQAEERLAAKPKRKPASKVNVFHVLVILVPVMMTSFIANVTSKIVREHAYQNMYPLKGLDDFGSPAGSGYSPVLAGVAIKEEKTSGPNSTATALAYLNLGRCYATDKAYLAQAEDSLKKAARIYTTIPNPTYHAILALNATGEVCQLRGNNTEAKQFYNQALGSAVTESPQAWHARALAAANLAKLSAGARDIEATDFYCDQNIKDITKYAPKLSDDLSVACTNAANMLDKLGAHDRAEKYRRLAIETLCKGSIATRLQYNLADTLIHEKKYDESSKLLNSLLKTNRHSSTVYLLLGKIAIAQNNYTKAKELLQQGKMQSSPYTADHGELMFDLARLYYDSKDYANAAECLKAATLDTSPHPMIFQSQEAMKRVMKALFKEPSYDKAWSEFYEKAIDETGFSEQSFQQTTKPSELS